MKTTYRIIGVVDDAIYADVLDPSPRTIYVKSDDAGLIRLRSLVMFATY
ncbi:hypothetical protein [Nevskia soli]|nr:hypothetical protein [Nevskia soli]